MQGSPATGIGKRRSYTIILLLVVALALLALQPKLREWVGLAVTRPVMHLERCSVSSDGNTVAVGFVETRGQTGMKHGILFISTATWRPLRGWVAPWYTLRFGPWNSNGKEIMVYGAPGLSSEAGYSWLRQSDLVLDHIEMPSTDLPDSIEPLGEGDYVLGEHSPKRICLWSPSRRDLRQLTPNTVSAGLVGVWPSPKEMAADLVYWVKWPAYTLLETSDDVSLMVTVLGTGDTCQVFPAAPFGARYALASARGLIARASLAHPDGLVTIQTYNWQTGTTEQFEAPCRPDQMVWSSENGYLLGTGARMWVYDVAAKTLSTLSATDAPKALEGNCYFAGALSTEGRFLVVTDTVLEVVDAKTKAVSIVLDINKH